MSSQISRLIYNVKQFLGAIKTSLGNVSSYKTKI